MNLMDSANAPAPGATTTTTQTVATTTITSTSTSGAAGATQTPSSGTMFNPNGDQNLCLSVPGGPLYDGAPVQVWVIQFQFLPLETQRPSQISNPNSS